MLKFFILLTLGFSLYSCQSSTDENNPVVFKNEKRLPNVPKSMVFFGSKIHFTDADIQERLDRELLVNIYFQSASSLNFKRSTRFFPSIEAILKEENVPLDFKYLCVIESGLSNAESPAGAMGFWQFMPFTAKEYGLVISNEIDERKDLDKSTRAACKLINKNKAFFQDWLLACAAYNRGAGGLQEDLNFQKVSHFFDTEVNPETARYVFRIMAMKLIMENPKKYGYNIPKNQCYDPYQFKEIIVNKDITNLAAWAIKNGTTRKNIRILNPWILGNTLTNQSIPCKIKIPTKSGNLRSYSKHL